MDDLKIVKTYKFKRVRKQGKKPQSEQAEKGRIPRISRLMALAIQFQKMLESGEVKDQAELAKLGHVSRARVTQIMNLLNLAPDIQEELLFLPRTLKGRDRIRERMFRKLTLETDWSRQFKLWHTMKER